jgi:hypothetical protein
MWQAQSVTCLNDEDTTNHTSRVVVNFLPAQRSTTFFIESTGLALNLGERFTTMSLTRMWQAQSVTCLNDEDTTNHTSHVVVVVLPAQRSTTFLVYRAGAQSRRALYDDVAYEDVGKLKACLNDYD